MAYVQIPLTSNILNAVRQDWGIVATGSERLHGGEESAAYRTGDHVVRIGPDWRTDTELEWCYAIASYAATRIPEAIGPRRTTSGANVVRVDGRPVTIWPFVTGTWADDRQEDARRQAADLLARLHRALGEFPVATRPDGNRDLAPAPELDVPDLDDWLAAFNREHQAVQALHGDFYAGNVLVEKGRIVGLLDWDDALIGPPERELAWAAWEWGSGLDTLDLSAALGFVDRYVAAGGPARAISEVELRQLVRERLCWEVRYNRSARARGLTHAADDLAYEARQLTAFQHLRP